MAGPIPFQPPARDLHAAALERLANAPREHVEALLSVYEILQGLHDEGVLDGVRGFLGSSDKIFQILVDAAKTPESIRALRNVFILAKIAGTLDPTTLEGVARAIPEGLTAGADPKPPPSLWRLLKMLGSADARRGLAALITMLRLFGSELGSSSRR
jgi:uncharacterized protein YjgD (DUF1641 family)